MREDRCYLRIPGTGMHELPPLLVRGSPETAPIDEVFGHAAVMVESEDIVPAAPGAEDVVEQRKFDLALNLVEQYRGLLAHWQWGDSILEWIRQCEMTFESQADLRGLLHADVWPHAGRSSFVALLMDKHVDTHDVAVDRAVGLRLTFRQPPPIDCFSNQFLFFLNSTLAGTAYQTWAELGGRVAGFFPPDRFHFEVWDLDRA